jgi:DNA repair ATPase RecN
MAEKQVIKVSDEEVKKIKDLRGSYQELIIQVGQAELQISDVGDALDNIIEAKSKLLERYNEIKQTERTHLDQLNEKYGVGSLNVDTGLFTPADNAPLAKIPEEIPSVEKQG